MVWLHGCLGLLAFIAIAWIFSVNRRQLPIKMIVIGLFWQVLLAIVLLRVSAISEVFNYINRGVQALSNASSQAAGFVFGYLGTGDAPYQLTGSKPFLFAFQAMPMLVGISALSALLFHWRILPIIIKGVSKVLVKVFGIGGALGVGAAANIFLGQSESPLVIRPYLLKLTHSELFSMMTVGMAGVAGSVMVLYSSILTPLIPGVLSRVIEAVLISIPAALTISRIIVPESQSLTGSHEIRFSQAQSSLDALTKGIMDGGKVIIAIILMFIGFLTLINLVNMVLSLLPNFHGQVISMQLLLGYIMSPFAWLMGIPWDQANLAGSLLGEKIVMNEVIAYSSLAQMGASLDPRSQMIMIYALCGFANIGSIGVQIGVYSTLAPERRQEIIAMGLRAVLAGTISTCMTGTLVGMLVA